MRTDKTQKLEKYMGQEVKVNYNVAQDVSKPAVLITGILRIYKTSHYEVICNGGNWINFTDDNVSNVWDESTPYIELKG